MEKKNNIGKKCDLYKGTYALGKNDLVFIK